MRTVVLSSLFFCMTLCVTLIPVFGKDHDPEKELTVTPETYIILVVPAIAALNALFVFVIYYAPLRRLFYALEKSLQTLVADRQQQSGGGGASVPPIPQSAMIDGDGTRHGTDQGISELLDNLSQMVQLRDMEHITESGSKVVAMTCSLLADSEELKQQHEERMAAEEKEDADIAPGARDHSPM